MAAEKVWGAARRRRAVRALPAATIGERAGSGGVSLALSTETSCSGGQAGPQAARALCLGSRPSVAGGSVSIEVAARVKQDDRASSTESAAALELEGEWKAATMHRAAPSS